MKRFYYLFLSFLITSACFAQSPPNITYLMVPNNSYLSLPVSGANGGTGVSNIGYTLTLTGSSSLPILTAPNSASLQMGLDSATPAVQAFQMSSAAAGSSNTAGADWHHYASRGTGTGIAGNIIFYGAPHSTTGTTQNSYTPMLSLNGDTLWATFGNGAVLENFNINGSNAANGGAYITFSKSGAFNGYFGHDSAIEGGSGTGLVIYAIGYTNFMTSTGGVVARADTTGFSIGGSADTYLTRAAANALKVGGTIITNGYTVGTLPSGIVGMRAYVTDQLTACPVVGAALTGSGAVTCPVFYNGTAWVSG